MKSKYFKILGVIAVVAMIAAALVAPVPASALSGVSLGVSGTTISATAQTYTITFTTGVAQPELATAFTLTFDSGINISAARYTFAAMASFTSNAVQTTAEEVAGYGVNNQVLTINTLSNTITAINQAYGAGTEIQIVVYGITNPATVGNFGVTVASNAESTGVYSNTFTTTVPTTVPLPGTASVYNSAGILMSTSQSLPTAISSVAAVGGGSIQLTAGTYGISIPDTAATWNAAIGALNAANSGAGCNITIQGASASTVIIEEPSAWILSGPTEIVENVTINGTNGGMLNMAATTAGTVTNCIFTGFAAGSLTSSAALNTVSNSTFNVATGATGLVASAATTVKGCTFTVAGTGIGISSGAAITASSDTFTGTSAAGFGVNLTGGTSTIGTSTFTGLTTALTVTAPAAVTLNGSTVTSCGVASGAAAIVVASTAAPGVSLYNNTISKSLDNIISVAANANLVNVMLNTFSSNVAAAASTDVNNTLNCDRNYWGGSANNPADVTTAPMINYDSPLGATPTATTYTTSSTLTAATTVGVNITSTTGAVTFLGASALKANPVTPTLPSNVTLQQYYDVFGTGSITNAVIDFYGTTASPVTANSAIYFYNTAYGTWQAASAQTVNVFGNYVEITVNTTNTPTPAQFSGTPFALVSVPTVLPTITPATPSPIFPANGATNVPVSGITFTWPAVTSTAGTVTYQFALAQASANTSANEFAILDYSDNTLTNAEPIQETMQYNAIYWWEVRAITMNASGGVAATGPWTVSMFTTMSMPATTTSSAAITVTQPITSIVVTQPVTTVQSTVTSVVITQTTGTSTQAIPSYLLWAVIAVGAILVIAVIVLIVRTRRIP